MPWANPDERGSEYIAPQATGPVMLTSPLYQAGNLPPATVAAGATWDSGVLSSDGYKVLAVGVTSSQAGQIIVQRYIDPTGTVAQGAALTAALTGGAAGMLNVTDGLPFAAFRIRISNTGGAAGNLTGYAALMAAA